MADKDLEERVEEPKVDEAIAPDDTAQPLTKEKSEKQLDDILEKEGIDKPKENLEKKLGNGMIDTFRKFTWKDWATIGTAGAISSVLGGGTLGYGAINTLSTMASYVIGNYIVNRKKGFDKQDIKSDITTGASMTPILYNIFKTLDMIQNPVGKLLALPYLVPLSIGSYQAMKYLNQQVGFFKMFGKALRPFKTIKEVYNNAWKDKFTSTLKKTYKYMTLPIAALVTVVPLQYMVPGSALARTGLGVIFKSSEKDAREKENNYTPPGISEPKEGEKYKPGNVLPMQPKDQYIPNQYRDAA